MYKWKIWGNIKYRLVVETNVEVTETMEITEFILTNDAVVASAIINLSEVKYEGEMESTKLLKWSGHTLACSPTKLKNIAFKFGILRF